MPFGLSPDFPICLSSTPPTGTNPGIRPPLPNTRRADPFPSSAASSRAAIRGPRKPIKAGKLIRELLTQAGHRIGAYHVVKDEPVEVRDLVRQLGASPGLEALIINGGTGISRRDSTFEAVDGLLEKRLPGFGELFRYLSYKEISSSAMLSRATAGLYQGIVLFSIPGSSGAVRLAMEALILPELPHIVGEMRK